MFQGDVQILLTIKVGGIAADPTLQPVIMAVVARQPRKSIVILRLRGGNAGGHHRFPVVRQRLLRAPLWVAKRAASRITSALSIEGGCAFACGTI